MPKACSDVAPSGPFTVYFWPSGLLKVNDGPWWTSTDQPRAGSAMGSCRHPSQGSPGSFAGSFCSGIARDPRELAPDGSADRLAEGTRARDRREAFDEITISLARGEAQANRPRLGRIYGANPATTFGLIYFHGPNRKRLLNEKSNHFRYLSITVRRRSPLPRRHRAPTPRGAARAIP